MTDFTYGLATWGKGKGKLCIASLDGGGNSHEKQLHNYEAIEGSRPHLIFRVFNTFKSSTKS